MMALVIYGLIGVVVWALGIRYDWYNLNETTSGEDRYFFGVLSLPLTMVLWLPAVAMVFSYTLAVYAMKKVEK